MKGRSRPYALGDAAKARSALSIALHERCDMIVATAALTGDQPTVQEPTVVEFLNSDVVLGRGGAGLLILMSSFASAACTTLGILRRT